MSAGYSLTKADLDARAGMLVKTLRDTLRDCTALCVLLNDTTIVPNDAFLTSTLSPGYTSGEVTWLRGAFTDLGGTGVSLARIATGLVAGPGSPNDFFSNAKHLTGVI